MENAMDPIFTLVDGGLCTRKLGEKEQVNKSK